MFDAIDAVSWLGGIALPPGCMDAADVQDDGDTDMFDALHILNWLGGVSPPPLPPCCDVPGDCGDVSAPTASVDRTAIAGDYKTIILTDVGRMAGSEAEKAALGAKLGELAARPEVNGVVVDVGQDPRVAEAIAGAAKFMVNDMWVPAKRGFHYTSCPKSSVGVWSNLGLSNGLSYAYKLSADKRIGAVLHQALDASLHTFSGFGKSLGQATREVPHTLSRIQESAFPTQ